MPEGEEEAVGGEDGGMGACLDLGFGVVDFEDLDVFWGESWVECCLNNGGRRGRRRCVPLTRLAFVVA